MKLTVEFNVETDGKCSEEEVKKILEKDIRKALKGKICFCVKKTEDILNKDEFIFISGWEVK